MGRLICLAIIFVLHVLLAAASPRRAMFRSCEDTAFCRRFRGWKKLFQRPVISVASVVFSESESMLSVHMTLQSSNETAVNYGLDLDLGKELGFIRMRIDDISPGQTKTRYRIPDGDVVEARWNTTGPYSARTVVRNESDSTVELDVSRLYTIIITKSPFKLSVMDREKSVLQEINSRNFFTLEKYRRNVGDRRPFETQIDMACHPEISRKGLWLERVGPREEFQDVKPFGPSAVGIDATFMNAVSVFGLPEHTTPFNLPVYREGSRRYSADIPYEETLDMEFRMFNADVYHHTHNSKMALYGSIPMITAVHNSSGGSAATVSAMLWLNPSDTYVSLTRRRKAVEHVESAWISETGILDIFFFVGPSPADVLQQYHWVTGDPALPPEFALGFHQSRWGWESEEVVKQINGLFEKHEIPLDVLWLDIQHTDGNRYMTWSPNYSNPIELTKNITASGRKLVTIVDPHVMVDPEYALYEEARKQGLLVKNFVGSDFIGNCWPGKSAYWDFTQKLARNLWAEKFSYPAYNGSSPDMFIWNDMNEPAVFDSSDVSMPRHARHGPDNSTLEHREVHNLYGFYNHWATFEGLLARDIPAKRPFVLSRSFFAGSHRFGPTWTGDNRATWDFMKRSLGMIQSLAISGMSFAGADVGGFWDKPDPEMYLRWHQLAAAAYPFYRGHSVAEEADRLPWTFGSGVMGLVRDAIELRYFLMPYWYTAFGMNALLGRPIVKPLWFDHLSDPLTFINEIATEEQIMVGDSILVRGIFQEDADEVQIYLPQHGSGWYNLHAPEDHPFAGGQFVKGTVSYYFIPMFVKAGSIIPCKVQKRLSTKFMRDDPFTLTVWPTLKGEAHGFLYLDDGDSMRYRTHYDYALVLIEFVDYNLSFTLVAGKRTIDDLKISDVDIMGMKPLKEVTVSGHAVKRVTFRSELRNGENTEQETPTEASVREEL